MTAFTGNFGSGSIQSGATAPNEGSGYEIPAARQALNQLKQETAAELGMPNYQGYRGHIPSRMNGAVGGHMVQKMIKLAESQMATGGPAAVHATAAIGDILGAQGTPGGLADGGLTAGGLAGGGAAGTR